MNNILADKINVISKLIEKVKSTINLSLDFDSIGVKQTSIYQTNLKKLESEIEKVIEGNYFNIILDEYDYNDKGYNNNIQIFSKKYCFLTIKLLGQIRYELECIEEFINNKNVSISKMDKEIEKLNKKEDSIEEKIKEKKSEIRNAESDLSQNLDNQAFVDSKNEELKNLYKALTTSINSLLKVREEKTKLELKKKKLTHGTHTSSLKFVKRNEVLYTETEIPKTSKLQKIIDESKNKYNDMMRLVNAKIDNTNNLVIKKYIEKISKLEKDIEESCNENAYIKIIKEDSKLTNEQLACGIYKLSILNCALISEGLEKLKNKENEINNAVYID